MASVAGVDSACPCTLRYSLEQSQDVLEDRTWDVVSFSGNACGLPRLMPCILEKACFRVSSEHDAAVPELGLEICMCTLE
jgi:hypothetical protein